jgi:hypothetical protein
MRYATIDPLLCQSTRLAGAFFSWGANSPFDKLRANEKACPFALSLSKGSFPPS